MNPPNDSNKKNFNQVKDDFIKHVYKSTMTDDSADNGSQADEKPSPTPNNNEDDSLGKETENQESQSGNPLEDILSGKEDLPQKEEKGFDLEAKLNALLEAAPGQEKGKIRVQGLIDTLKEQAEVNQTQAKQFDSQKIEFEKQIAQLQEKIDAYESKNKELSGLEQFLGSDEYSQKILEPKKEAIGALDAILKRNNVEASAAEILSLKGDERIAKLNEIWGDIGGYDQSDFKDALTKHRSAELEEAELKKNPDSVIESLRTKRAEQESALKAKAQKAIQEHINNVVLKNPILQPMKTEGVEDEQELSMRTKFNESLSALGDDIQRYAGESEPIGRADVAAKAAMFDRFQSGTLPILGKKIVAQTKQIAELKEQVKKLSASRPGVNEHNKQTGNTSGLKEYSIEAIYEASQV